ncbi:hypothetical protein PYJP_17310 [Pyrofollis japonicus]|uniref:4Fe-4S binding protein n=1 Tax=Pyrofollis japonicus TaxID=3060460 RepID=UPI00295AF886|nr:4Fe-4S binding protein [Pyrofollis japonicus]BEP18379.1 hypothetical protein PYJP_17310 [Pyrofollis japonicus]
MLKPLRRMLRDTLGPTETLRYPEEELPRDHVEQLRGFVYLAHPESCISCGACRDICPNKVIELRPFEINGSVREVPVFHANMCMACGLCVEVCPTSALDFSSIIALVSDSPDIVILPNHSKELTEKKERGETRWRYQG